MLDVMRSSPLRRIALVYAATVMLINASSFIAGLTGNLDAIDRTFAINPLVRTIGMLIVAQAVIQYCASVWGRLERVLALAALATLMLRLLAHNLASLGPFDAMWIAELMGTLTAAVLFASVALRRVRVRVRATAVALALAALLLSDNVPASASITGIVLRAAVGLFAFALGSHTLAVADGPARVATKESLARGSP